MQSTGEKVNFTLEQDSSSLGAGERQTVRAQVQEEVAFWQKKLTEVSSGIFHFLSEKRTKVLK